MFEPDESDIVAATVEWAKEHGRQQDRVLSLTHGESNAIWRRARIRAVKRVLRNLFGGERQAPAE
jgi:hypothetical protein